MTANIVYRGKSRITSALQSSGALWTSDGTSIGVVDSIVNTPQGAIIGITLHATPQGKEAAKTLSERHARSLKSYVTPVLDGSEVIGFVVTNYGTSKDLSVIAPSNIPSKQANTPFTTNWRF